MGRFSEALRSLNNLKLLAAIGRSGGELSNVADLVDNFLGSPQMADCVRRFRQVPGGSSLMDERYPPLQPNIDALLTLPEGTLGRRYAGLIRQLGYDPEFFRPRPIESEEQWLTQRIATTHDIHHVVSGFGTEPEGESGVLAITAAQIGFPAYVLLTGASQLANFRFRLEQYRPWLRHRQAGRVPGGGPLGRGLGQTDPAMAAGVGHP
jgi:ubiquinone biosynthesis protein COQ4